MNEGKLIINLERLISLFSIFFIGTLAIILYFYLNPGTNSWLINLKFSFLLITIISYEYVALSLLSHYFILHKEKIIIHIIKNKGVYLMTIFAIGFLSYLILDYSIYREILKTIQKGIYLILLLFGGFVLKKGFEWLIKKKRSTNQKS